MATQQRSPARPGDPAADAPRPTDGGSRRRGGWRLTTALSALTGLLLVIAVSTRARLPGPVDGHVETFERAVLLAALAVLGLLVTVAAVLWARVLTDRSVPPAVRVGIIAVPLVMIGIVVLLVLQIRPPEDEAPLLPALREFLADEEESPDLPVAPEEPEEPLGEGVGAADPTGGRLGGALIALGGAVLLAAVGWALWARRLADPVPPSQVREPLTAALRSAIDDVAHGSDTAQAVIRAYARMEQVLADKGVPRRPSEAPFEYLGRTLVTLGASAPAADRLTALFELAKFSRHEIDVDMRDEAVAALGEVRAQLEEER